MKTISGTRQRIETYLAWLAAAAFSGVTTLAGPADVDDWLDEPYRLDSRWVSNSTAETRAENIGAVYVPGASWVRLHIGDHYLGRSSYVTLTSLLDGEVQRFDSRSLADWYQWSAIFNGDEVDVTLHVAPGDDDVFVQVDQVRHSVFDEAESPASQRSICNDFDDRASSGDPRVGRSPGCTAWLVSNGAVLTAGHCPVAAGSIVQFNVPASSANGVTVAGSVNDQYPIDMASIRFENNGRGEDWMVFGLNPNATTGLRAHRVQGFFYMTLASPAIETTLRVTGYGLDNIPAGSGGPGAACCDSDGDGACEFNCNATSQTQQSTTGRLDDLDGSIIEHDVDTMPANSGSPIIWEETGEYTIGIHTQGGCDDFFAGYNNHGTRFNRGPLAGAVQNFLGPNTTYVDWADVGLPSNGNVFEPFRTVAQAVAAVPDNGIIALVPGSYPRAAGNTFVAGADGKAFTFLAPVGPAVIGN